MSTPKVTFLMLHFCERLKQIRGDRSQAEVARILGLKQQNWARWENGIVFPGAEALHHICATFHVSADWLLGIGDKAPEKDSHQEESDRVDAIKQAIINLLKQY